MLTGVSSHRGSRSLYQIYRPIKEHSGHTPVDEALTEKCKTHADAAWKGLLKKVKDIATKEEKLEFLKKCQKRYKKISKGKGIEYKDAWANKYAAPIEGLVMALSRALSKR